MSGQTTERAFETYVEEILLTGGGWKSGSNAELGMKLGFSITVLNESFPARSKFVKASLKGSRVRPMKFRSPRRL